MAPSTDNQLTDRDLKVKVAPRLVQASRLNFRFVSAENDENETGLVAGANPVCGWLLPNHLDSGLSVYNAQGQPLGELLLLWEGPHTSVLNWLPAPESPTAAATPDDIENEHLRQIVKNLISLDQGKGTAFNNLLR